MEQLSQGLTPAARIIPEKNIIVFAPHYDDGLFLLGNCALGWQQAGLQKNIHILVLFSRSNYLQGSGAENFDTSLDRLKLATGMRLLEDNNCLNELLGSYGYRYELAGEDECFVREKPFAKDAMEFPQGMFPDFDEKDWAIFARMKARISAYTLQEDTALVFPLAIKEHIDHFIVREAAIQAAEASGPARRAAFYFQEDKPYGGIATREELNRLASFLSQHSLEQRVYRAHPEKMIDLAFTHYVSQTEELYKTGIRHRAEVLRAQHHAQEPCDVLYRLALS